MPHVDPYFKGSTQPLEISRASGFEPRTHWSRVPIPTTRPPNPDAGKQLYLQVSCIWSMCPSCTCSRSFSALGYHTTDQHHSHPGHTQKRIKNKMLTARLIKMQSSQTLCLIQYLYDQDIRAAEYNRVQSANTMTVYHFITHASIFTPCLSK